MAARKSHQIKTRNVKNPTNQVKLQMKKRYATFLIICPYCFGLKQVDENEDSDGMDDDAMFRIDAYLAAMFSEKRIYSATQSQFLPLKFRVLSLLEIYLHKNPGNSTQPIFS